jgi:hypothetical protein
MPTTDPSSSGFFSINAPTGMTFDATSGHLFILDVLADDVYEVTTDGKLVVNWL